MGATPLAVLFGTHLGTDYDYANPDNPAHLALYGPPPYVLQTPLHTRLRDLDALGLTIHALLDAGAGQRIPLTRTGSRRDVHWTSRFGLPVQTLSHQNLRIQFKRLSTLNIPETPLDIISGARKYIEHIETHHAVRLELEHYHIGTLSLLSPQIKIKLTACILAWRRVLRVPMDTSVPVSTESTRLPDGNPGEDYSYQRYNTLINTLIFKSFLGYYDYKKSDPSCACHRLYSSGHILFHHSTPISIEAQQSITPAPEAGVKITVLEPNHDHLNATRIGEADKPGPLLTDNRHPPPQPLLTPRPAPARPTSSSALGNTSTANDMGDGPPPKATKNTPSSSPVQQGPTKSTNNNAESNSPHEFTPLHQLGATTYIQIQSNPNTRGCPTKNTHNNAEPNQRHAITPSHEIGTAST